MTKEQVLQAFRENHPVAIKNSWLYQYQIISALNMQLVWIITTHQLGATTLQLMARILSRHYRAIVTITKTAATGSPRMAIGCSVSTIWAMISI